MPCQKVNEWLKKCPKCECPAGEKMGCSFADFHGYYMRKVYLFALYTLASVNVENKKL